jgi:regulator of chromosome condensation
MPRGVKRPASPIASKKRIKLSLPGAATGDVFVVGSGDCGQLGLGEDVLEKLKPSLLPYFADKQIVAVYAGGLHNIVLSNKGKLYSWGCNDQKALGRDGEETEPGPVQGLDDEFIVSVACGDSISCCLTREGKVYAWGTFRDKTGIFGFAPGIDLQPVPKLIPELAHIVHIAAGTNHLVAVSETGTVVD